MWNLCWYFCDAKVGDIDQLADASSVLFAMLLRYRFSRVNIKINVFDDITCTYGMQSFIAVIEIIRACETFSVK